MSGICRKCVVYRQNKQSHLYFFPLADFFLWNEISLHIQMSLIFTWIFTFIYITSYYVYYIHSIHSSRLCGAARQRFSSHRLLLSLCRSAAPVLYRCVAAAQRPATAQLVLRSAGWRSGGSGVGMKQETWWIYGTQMRILSWKIGIIMALSWEYHGNVVGNTIWGSQR